MTIETRLTTPNSVSQFPGCQIESIANKQMTESFANMRTLCLSIYYSNNSNSLHVSKELSIIMALLEFCPHSHSKTLLIYRRQR